MKKSVMARTLATLIASAWMATGVIVPAHSAETANAINTPSRDAVVNAYKTRYLPATTVNANWTGAVAGCNPGTQSADSLAKGASAINFFRGLAGLDSITLTSSQNSMAQAAALMMEANRTLSHSPTAGWTCYTEQGRAGAASSNLHYSDPQIETVSQPVLAYMTEQNSGSTEVGHRRWLLNPETTTMGFGTTKMANAINVIGGGTSSTRANPEFIAFPNAGYFPQQLEPSGLWSLSSDQGIDFTNAKVKVTNANGTDMAAVVKPSSPGYGPNSLVFAVPALAFSQNGGESNYTVAVTGMVKTGQLRNHTYTVKFIDGLLGGPSTPDPVTPVPPAGPSISSPGSVVSIDAAGDLWNYGTMQSPRVKIGAGWSAFDDVHVTDWNRDGYFDLVGKAKAGQLYLFQGVRTGGFSKAMIGTGGWQNFNIDIGVWKKTDRYPSVIAKHKTTGQLYLYANPSGRTPATGVQIGNGWQQLEINLLDWNRDGNTDIVAKHAGGQLFLYRTNGGGSFLSERRPVIGSGWQNFTSVTVIREFNGPGTRGLLARTSAGALLYYQANTAVWAAPRTVGSGWTGHIIANH